MQMEIGKLPSELLEELIFRKAENSPIKKQEVILRPGMGEDCSVMDMGDELLILSTDPITGACENIGSLLVNVNINDIYSSGCIPVGLLVTLLLPPDFTEGELMGLSDELFAAAEKAELEILGGHTEITDAVNRPVVSATVIGKSVGRRFIKTSGAAEGQDVIMTKYAGLEGTSILAADFEDRLSDILPSDVISKAKSLEKYLSIKKEALIAADFGASSMHDVTEGGILGAAAEVADSSGLGITVWTERIPILEETKTICSVFGIDPLRLISSGSLLIAAFNGDKLVKRLKKEGINAAIIGRMTSEGKKVITNGKESPLGDPEPDHIYRAKL